MKSGALMILGPDSNCTGRKVFDLKIINTFPIITIESQKRKLITKEREIEINEYQHISVPPDLQLHLTKSNGHGRHLGFNTDLVNLEDGTLKEKVVRLFTWCSQPISTYREPTGTWNQVEIICLGKDNMFTEHTGIFVDFFVHKNQENVEDIAKIPYIQKNMRHISDNHGNIVGPYQFNEIVRGGHKIIANYFFTIRFGYYEIEKDHAILNIPFSLKS